MRLCACITAALVAFPARGQIPAPDPHFGANAFPAFAPELRFTVSLNRFTEFDGEGKRFNEVEETSGFNVASLSYTDSIPDFPALTYTAVFGVGLTRDQPTETLQNDFIHGILDLAEVGTDGKRNSTELVTGLSVNWWLKSPWASLRRETAASKFSLDPFVGAGASAGTLYQEFYAQAGVRFAHPIGGDNQLRWSGMERWCWPTRGDAFDDVATYSRIDQLSLAFVPSSAREDSTWCRIYYDFLGNPEVEVTLTRDSGLFVDSGDDPIRVYFGGLRVKWPTGLLFETWNDIVGGTDFGPTFGVLLGFDLRTFFGSWR